MRKGVKYGGIWLMAGSRSRELYDESVSARKPEDRVKAKKALDGHMGMLERQAQQRGDVPGLMCRMDGLRPASCGCISKCVKGL